MDKEISEMTLEELWVLFPIILLDHDPVWEEYYNEEESSLKEILPDYVRINHIGSTAVLSIKAKAIIDILVEIPKNIPLTEIKKILVANKYLCMNERENRISFNKGYTKYGFEKKVFHLHLRYYNDNDELYFRDYLNDHTDIAKMYENLKKDSAEVYKNNRDEYTSQKTDFAKKYTLIAKEEYHNKYYKN